VSPGVAFAVDYFDPSLRTPDELRDVLQIPVLAALPKAKGKRHVS
jgi:capsular polysaccharide biosynthesis protein